MLILVEMPASATIQRWRSVRATLALSTSSSVLPNYHFGSLKLVFQRAVFSLVKECVSRLLQRVRPLEKYNLHVVFSQCLQPGKHQRVIYFLDTMRGVVSPANGH